MWVKKSLRDAEFLGRLFCGNDGVDLEFFSQQKGHPSDPAPTGARRKTLIAILIKIRGFLALFGFYGLGVALTMVIEDSSRNSLDGGRDVPFIGL